MTPFQYYEIIVWAIGFVIYLSTSTINEHVHTQGRK